MPPARLEKTVPDRRELPSLAEQAEILQVLQRNFKQWMGLAESNNLKHTFQITNDALERVRNVLMAHANQQRYDEGRFCLCDKDYKCAFHRRGGYATPEDFE